MPYPHVEIEGLPGYVTGRVILFKDKITGGKSDLLGPSNGFFVNILGRVINYTNTDFGLDNLSHGAWAQFRATIRADGLDDILSVERDGLREGKELDLFKAFLRSIFNKARAYRFEAVYSHGLTREIFLKSPGTSCHYCRWPTLSLSA